MMTLEDCRAFYAQEIRFEANVTTPGLVEAFARVPREMYLGPAPWYIGSAETRALSAAGLGQMSYLSVEDPRDLYHNAVVSIDRSKDLNNGQPGSLARWIDSPGAKTWRPRVSPRLWRPATTRPSFRRSGRANR